LLALKYAKHCSFIEVITLPQSEVRSFASKVRAFNLGYHSLDNTSFDFIGNLDADVSFQPDYYERIIRCFSRRPNLGIAGGLVCEDVKGAFKPVRCSLDSVAGAVQLFRARCYHNIGGYRELKYGGIDAVAELSAKRHGWQVQTFPDIRIHHHRQIGSSEFNNSARRYFSWGVRNYSIGYHPLFFFFRCILAMKEPPVVIGGMLMTIGFTISWLCRFKKAVPPEFVRYVRKAQKEKLRLRHAQRSRVSR
jgi:hypothetical protein